MLISGDLGRTWSPHGLSGMRVTALSCVAGARLRARAHGSPSDGRVLACRGGNPWEPVLEAGAMPNALLARDGSLFAGLADGRVLQTGDAGVSWERVDVALGAPVWSLSVL